MADTITVTCKICEEEFDSIPEIDNGICDDCEEEYPLVCPSCGRRMRKDSKNAECDDCRIPLE